MERNDNFDLNEAFGPVAAGSTIDGVIELVTAMGKVATYELKVSFERVVFFKSLQS